jgi:hypothetical protein
MMKAIRKPYGNPMRSGSFLGTWRVASERMITAPSNEEEEWSFEWVI